MKIPISDGTDLPLLWRMDLRQLRYFLGLAERGSFTRAAAALHVSQPALSLAIAKLEESLGQALFTRGGRHVRLTRAGERLLAPARDILARVAEAEAQTRSGAAPRRRLRIGAPALIAAAWLPPVLAAFLRAEPGTAIELSLDGARAVEKKLIAGELDLGLFSEYQAAPEISVTPLFQAELGVCVAARHALARRTSVTWSQFLAQPLVLLPRGYYQRELIEAEAARRNRALDVRAETDALPVLKAILAGGDAAAMLMRMSVRRGEGLKVVPMTPAQRIRMSAGHVKTRERDATITCLIEHLKAHAPA